jgi:uncharacterized membrane protein YccC
MLGNVTIFTAFALVVIGCVLAWLLVWFLPAHRRRRRLNERSENGSTKDTP